MKTRMVIVSLITCMVSLHASAQRAEYDDMYFTAKDREKNKAIAADDSEKGFVTNKNKKTQETVVKEETDPNPTDSYSARTLNPEYVSRANAEQASEDEANYYLDGYTPASTFTPTYTNSYYSNTGYNNSYYNNSNWARNSWYGNAGWGNPYSAFGYGYNNGYRIPYYGGGYNYYDPWGMNSPYYGGGSGWSLSFSYGFGNFYNPYSYYGYNAYNYYGGGYPYYYNNNGGGYETSRPNYGKRPSRHSAVVTPTQRLGRSNNSLSSTIQGNNTTNSRTRQTTDEYYVKPARRTTVSSGNTSRESSYTRPTSTDSRERTRPLSSTPSESRTREYTAPRESRTPSYSPPANSPSRGSSGGGSSGGGGSSSPRPRGRD